MLHIFSFLLQLGFKKFIVSLVVVVFIIVIFVIVVFVLAHCRNMQNNVPHGPQLKRLSFPHPLLFMKVVLKEMLYISTYRMAATIKMA